MSQFSLVQINCHFMQDFVFSRWKNDKTTEFGVTSNVT